MTGGALNFTLGLQANQFLNAMGIASGKLVAFMGATQLVTKAFRSMWDAIQQGGKFTDLAAAASISVKELYQLRFAFEQIGASADSVGSVILRMRANLAKGNQDDVLTSLGLNPEQLRSMGVTEQFDRIAGSLGKLNATARAGAAQSLFGREGANVAQMIGNSGTAFADAMAAAAKDATVWDQVSNTFDMIADKVTALQRHMETMWAQLAGALIQAFNEGRIGELLTDIFTTALRAAFDALPSLAIGGLVKIGEILLRIVHETWAQFQTMFDYVAEKLTLGSANWDELLQANRDNSWSFFGAGLEDISNYANSKFQSGIEAGAAAFGGLSDRLNEFVARLPQGGALSTGVAGVDFQAAKGMTTDVTSLEKMGGVLLGLGRGFGGDEAKQTAQNTRRTADLLARTNELLAQQGQENYTNV